MNHYTSSVSVEDNPGMGQPSGKFSIGRKHSELFSEFKKYCN